MKHKSRKTKPLFSRPKNSDRSGLSTKIIPEDVTDKNIAMAAGLTVGSKMSLRFIFNRLHLKGIGLGKVSSTNEIKIAANTAAIAAKKNSPVKPTISTIGEDKNWPIPNPNEINTPQIPIPTPLFFNGEHIGNKRGSASRQESCSESMHKP